MKNQNKIAIGDIQEEFQQIAEQAYGPTGYFENLINSDLGLNPGQTGWFKDNANRFVVVLSTDLGNIVFFQRYSNRFQPVVYNAPDEVERVLPGPANFDWDQVLHWAGFSMSNNLFQDLFDAVKELDSN